MIKLNLQQLLSQRNISQKQLSEATGIRPATISLYCNNNFKQISMSHIDKICYVLNCNPTDIFYYSRVSKPEGIPDNYEEYLSNYLSCYVSANGDDSYIFDNSTSNWKKYLNKDDFNNYQSSNKDKIDNIKKDIIESLTPTLDELIKEYLLEFSKHNK